MTSQLIGDSPAIRDIRSLVSMIAKLSASVLILGEPGTGKELLASLIHREGREGDAPFIAVNLSGIPGQVAERALFGDEPSSFTGADRQQLGKFELASNGTLFLDEINELPLDLQAKLLRAVQEGEVEHVGGTKPIKTNFRLIAATNPDIEKAVREGRFREDLYYRLNTIPIRIPPLRERSSDIPLLFEHFWKLSCERQRFDVHQPMLGAGVVEALIRYRWRGNVRELQQIVERLCTLAANRTIELADLPPEISGLAESRASEFEIVFAEEFSPRDIRDLLTAIADYYRVCGGAGLQVTFEAEAVPALESVIA